MKEQRLTVGLDPGQQDELGDLTALEAHLSAYDTPEPDTAALLARLTAPKPAPQPHGIRQWTRLAQAQMALVSGRFWLATLLMLALGVLLVAAYGGAMLVVYALVSPVLAVIGTAYLFRPEARTLRELELFGAYGPLELLYVRLLLVLAYTTGITVILLLAASTQGAQVVLWRLLVIWLGPMVGLTGVALYSTVRWNAFAGVAVPMSMWAALLGLGWREFNLPSLMSSNPAQLLAAAISQSDGILISALAALASGVFLIWRAGVWVTHEAGA